MLQEHYQITNLFQENTYHRINTCNAENYCLEGPPERKNGTAFRSISSYSFVALELQYSSWESWTLTNLSTDSFASMSRIFLAFFLLYYSQNHAHKTPISESRLSKPSKTPAFQKPVTRIAMAYGKSWKRADLRRFYYFKYYMLYIISVNLT